MTICASVTARLRLTLTAAAGLAESVTLKVSAVPALCTVGVPVMAPVAAFSCRPAGKAPLVSVQVYGATPPVAVSVAS